MSYTREQFIRAVLAGIGNTSPSQLTVDFGIAWTQLETTGPPGATYNLLNTTEPFKPDGTPYQATNFNSVGVKNYTSFADGVQANVKVLKNGRYPHLLAALQGNDMVALLNPSAAMQQELSTWGTGHAAQIAQLAGQAANLKGNQAFPGLAGTPTPAPQPQTQAGTSVSTLASFIMVPERTPITGDTHPSENSGLNCVPASILAGVMFLLGIKQLGGKFTPDSFKDAVYGQGTTGGESPSAYVGYLKSEFGIAFTSFKGTPAAMVAEAHRQIAAGRPVVFTIPNPYGNPNYTHVCVFYGTGQRTLTAMDPWLAAPVTKSDASWAGLLLNNKIWIMSKIGGDMPTPLTINDVRQYFNANPDGSWTRIGKDSKPVLDSAGKAIVLKGAIKDDWCSHGTLALADIGLPEDNETQVDPAAHPEVVDQQFERTIRRYDPNHVKDSPPHAGTVYSPHIEELYGAQTKLTMALDQLAATQKVLASLQAGAAPGSPSEGAAPGPESAYVAAVKSIKSIVDPLAV